MDRWNYDNTKSNGSSFAGPFLMGLAVGIAGTAVYAAARSGRMGSFMEKKIHGFEDGAVNVKNTVVDKAVQAKDAVVNRFHKSDGQMEDAMAGGKGRSKNSAA